jgi:arylsulfatase A
MLTGKQLIGNGLLPKGEKNFRQQILQPVNISRGNLGTPNEPVRDHLIIGPSRKSHLSIRKGKWMYIPAQDEGGFGGTKIGLIH